MNYGYSRNSTALAFATMCVDLTAKAEGCCRREMYLRMKTVGLKPGLTTRLDALHTQSKDYVEQLYKLPFSVWKQQIINNYAYGFSWCNSNSGLADYICGAVKRFSKKGGKVMLRDSQLWMKIGRICT